MLAKYVNFENFVQKTVRKKGILGLGAEDPHITKVNQQILMLEEIFENRRNLKIKRPRIKDQVMEKLRNSIATPAFLKSLKKESRRIDKYLREHGFQAQDQDDGELGTIHEQSQATHRRASAAEVRKREGPITEMEE